ncbi:hypothetical protein EK21DRAFT_56577 [Setomelanomma holmii]|uniref:FHA domain-containing protein n=1 Tax=Setomelanomma holmii TaxID=210430 RepID=A0A9P4HH67_9PLEO|nr:hypothetical protein EK21DRAFT_56577 [Setomelanomma holmii]
MWFLEHESLFGGKRVWLRPGSQQLFGRTKSTEKDGAEGKQWKIDNKAVSRKHVMLKVYDAQPADGTKLHARSKIEVIDLSCRQGTTIDEKTMLKSKKLDDGTLEYEKAFLTGTEHTIRLAQGYAPFKIVWRPMVFTYATRESKESKARSAQLHALDMKTTTDFLFDKTTHVVTQKRNLPKVLSGLVASKHIVTGDFLDDVLRVATRALDADQNYEPSKLEEDFDEWWPKEKECIPPAGSEPVARPPELLAPDTSRIEVFSGLTFVFLQENQYNNLLDPIGGGGGKGLLYNIEPGKTTVQEYVDYVHSVAGKKKRNGTSGDKLPIVTVRLADYPNGMEEWAANFVIGTDQSLNQRSILQNEFLDVILTKDCASLQRPPLEIVKLASNAPDPALTRRSARESTPLSQPRDASPAKSASPEKTQPVRTIPRKRPVRPRTGGRFTGFDDYEPPRKRPKVEDVPMENVQESAQPSISTTATSRSRHAPATQSQPSQRSPVNNTIEKEEQMDSLFPAAAAIKRQRAATRAPSASVEPESSGPAPQTIGKGKAALQKLQRAQAKADSKEFNVVEHTRQRVKEEEERRKADEESLREALEGIDIAEMRNLAPVEEMELRPRASRVTARQSQVDSDRWDPGWNGRKNFKKFRRRGAERGVQPHKVLVTLEEAPQKKGFGVGDTFFLEDVEPSATFRSRHSGRKQQVEDSSEPEPGFTRRKRTSNTEVINVEDSGLESEEEGPVARTQKSSGRTQRVAETQVDETETQTQGRGKKRGAVAASGQPASKRGRVRRRDDDSDEEETGFRFKRRG